MLPLSPESGAEGTRTPDLYSAIVALSQLSYSPKLETILQKLGAFVKLILPRVQARRSGVFRWRPGRFRWFGSRRLLGPGQFLGGRCRRCSGRLPFPRQSCRRRKSQPS